MNVRLHIVALALLVSTACAGTLSPKAAVDTYDRSAYASVRAFQVAEETAWHAKGPWPTAAQHITLNVKVSSIYQLIIDTANLGVALPAGSSLSTADLAVIGNLQQLVTDLIGLVQGSAAPPSAVSAASAVKVKTDQLAAKVKGA